MVIFNNNNNNTDNNGSGDGVNDIEDDTQILLMTTVITIFGDIGSGEWGWRGDDSDTVKGTKRVVGGMEGRDRFVRVVVLRCG